MSHSSGHDAARKAPTADSIFEAGAISEERVAALRRYDLLDTEREEAFDRLTELAADLFDVKAAFVAFLDTDRQWLKSKVDLGQKGSGLVASFCTATVQEEGLLVIENVDEDERTEVSPNAGEAGLRFYAGVPILSPGGLPIGTFSIIGSEPKALSEEEKGRLKDLAQMTTEELERRRDAREHKQLARRFEAVLQDPNVVVAVLSPEGMLLDTNEAALQYIGQSKEEVLGLDLWKTPWWPEEMRNKVRRWVRRAAGGEYVDFEAELLGVGGTTHNVEGRIRPVTGEDGDADTLIVSARDVTERRRQAKELRMLSGAVEQTKEAVLITEALPIDEPGPRIVYVNEAFEEMSGWAKEEIVGETPRILQGPETRREILDSVREALEGEEKWEGEAVNYRKDGTPYRVQWNVAPVLGEDEEIEYWVSVQRDVTKERRREEKLRERTRQLEQIRQNVQDVVWMSTPNKDTMEFISEAYEEVWGRPTEELKENPTSFLEGIHPEDREHVLSAMEVQTERPEAYDETYRVVQPDGEVRWVHDRATGVRGEDRSLERIIGIATDITMRKEREHQLQRYQEYTDRLLNATDDLFIVLDEEGRFERWNDRVPEATGYSDEEIAEMSAFDLVPEDDLEQAAASFEDAFAAGSGRIQVSLLRKDGTTVPYEIVGNLVEHPEGGPRVVGIGRDIGERKERKRRLQQAETFFQNAQDALFLVDVGAGNEAFTIQRVNPAYETATGFSKEDIRGCTPQDIFGVEAGRDVEKRYRACTQEREPLEYEEKLPIGETTTYWQTRIAPVVVEGEIRQIVGTTRDVTDQKKRERELVEAKEKAEQANRLKSAFLANMSHEIRTPLTSILGFAEAIGQEVGPSEDRDEIDLSSVSQFAGLIEKSGRRLMETLNAVLNLSKLQAGEMDLTLRPIDLRAEAEEMTQEFGPEAKNEGLDLRLETPEAPVRALSNEGGLQIALRNLVSNAIKYSEPGDKIWVRVREESSGAFLEVEDTGIGMDPDRVEELFEPFQQESEGMAREYEGTGLGLALTKRVVEKMEGEVCVETEKEQGTMITIRLPKAARET